MPALELLARIAQENIAAETERNYKSRKKEIQSDAAGHVSGSTAPHHDPLNRF
jgi:hypothetical protein